MSHSQTPDNGLVSAQVVRPHRLDPVSAHEIQKPVRESVRIALCHRFQPQNFARRGGRRHAHDRFLALHANHRLVRAYHCHMSDRPTCLFLARVPSRFLNVAPLMRDMETPKAASRRLAERGDSPSAHASAAHPRIRRVWPLRSIPGG